MSKKVLIIKPTVRIDQKTLNESFKNIAQNIHEFGFTILSNAFDYEVVEIEGIRYGDTVDMTEPVVKQKPSVDPDAIIKELEDYIFEDPKDVAESAWNNAFRRAIRTIKEKTDE